MWAHLVLSSLVDIQGSNLHRRNIYPSIRPQTQTQPRLTRHHFEPVQGHRGRPSRCCRSRGNLACRRHHLRRSELVFGHPDPLNFIVGNKLHSTLSYSGLMFQCTTSYINYRSFIRLVQGHPRSNRTTCCLVRRYDFVRWRQHYLRRSVLD